MKILNWIKECFTTTGIVIGVVAGIIMTFLLLLILQPVFWLAIVTITLIIYLL